MINFNDSAVLSGSIKHWRNRWHTCDWIHQSWTTADHKGLVLKSQVKWHYYSCLGRGYIKNIYCDVYCSFCHKHYKVYLLQGDSGGPAVVKRSSTDATIVGVVSYGNGCAKPNNYGVYTDVYTYLPWIKSVLAVSYLKSLSFALELAELKFFFINI